MSKYNNALNMKKLRRKRVLSYLMILCMGAGIFAAFFATKPVFSFSNTVRSLSAIYHLK